MDTAGLTNALSELALDLGWSWSHTTDELWAALEPEVWELTRNAWVVLQTVSRRKLQEALADKIFVERLTTVLEERRLAEKQRLWFHDAWPESKLSAVAYFSMEFMLTDALPIFSGGLGNVAGDQLKTASDLGVPVIGVGLLYQQGYFRQHIDAVGNQVALQPYNDPGQLPIVPLRDKDGEWLRIAIQLPGSMLHIRTWQVQVGRTRLYLLDTNDPSNLPEHRGITSELYGGGPNLRLQQERVLGIGGWRLLKALGIEPEVCHLNEGHAAFVVAERARTYMISTGQPFRVALAVTRAGNLFTTHTPVAAGFDRFTPVLMKDQMRAYAEEELGISIEDFLALGRLDPHNGAEPFNMAYLAIRGCGAVNGVSRLHGQVSRRLFQPLFPRWPELEVPVGHVTNGVHMPTWDSAEADELWTSVCGKSRWRSADLKTIEGKMRSTPAPLLWNMRQRARHALIDYLRKRLARQLAGHGAPREEIEEAGRILDPDVLTLGFARRFTAYKRPSLLLHDPDRLLRILGNTQRPVQLVLAGKAHPRDMEAQAVIRRWIEFIRHTPARSQAVFLSDDDMGLTEHLVNGVDLWLNTPKRPWEASGTSGMKILVNGGLNFSELDGWWAEAYSPDVGWALGDGREHDEPDWDAVEAEQMYNRLENEIIPEFYNRDENGLPVAWIAKLRESMARLTPQFSAIRVLREYTEQHYLPLAHAYLDRAKGSGGLGAALVRWQNQLEQHWSHIRFGALKVTEDAGRYTFSVQAWLDGLDPDAVVIELFADATGDGAPVRHAMLRGQPLVGAENGFTWTITIPANRPADHFVPRILPGHPQALIPLECARVLWYQ